MGIIFSHMPDIAQARLTEFGDKNVKKFLSGLLGEEVHDLEDKLEDLIKELGLFIITMVHPTGFILGMVYIKAAILKGALAFADQKLIEKEEAITNAKAVCSHIWRVYARLYHGQEWEGFENIPRSGGALIIYFHGSIQVDYFALVAEIFLRMDRSVHNVVDRFLMDIPGLDEVREHFNMFPGTREECTEVLRSGHLLGIAPGGAYESMFGNSNYPVLWRDRQGFAAVALAADVPIIPVFTENIREVTFTMAGRMATAKKMWEDVYLKKRIPVVPNYGLFPVYLKTHIGKPIYPSKDMAPEQLARLTRETVEQMIAEHQKLPGSLSRALMSRMNLLDRRQSAII